jgi:hypothetical protein
MGVWILDFDWIKACISASSLVPEYPYEVTQLGTPNKGLVFLLASKLYLTGCSFGPTHTRMQRAMGWPNGLIFWIHLKLCFLFSGKYFQHSCSETGTAFLVLPDDCFFTQAQPGRSVDQRTLPDLLKPELVALLEVSGINILQIGNPADVEVAVETALLNPKIKQLVLIGGNNTAGAVDVHRLEALSSYVSVIHWRWIMICAIRGNWCDPSYSGEHRMLQPLSILPAFIPQPKQ